NKNLFEISTIIFSLKIEKRRILGEKFSQNPPLNGGVGGSGPLKPKKYLLIFTQNKVYPLSRTQWVFQIKIRQRLNA
ncbi:MAG: hypothetical protein II419_03890, partial [Acidaminococcaceae bacterium]|nr:hypothetical protein [Acidaminococcaceae bacterium]